MPHEYRPPKKYPSKGNRKHVVKSHEDKSQRSSPKSLGNEVTRKDSIHAKLMKQLFWCPKCNIPLLAKTCACNTESIRIDLQQPFDVRPALKADYDLILETFRKRFGGRVTLPHILVLNKAGGLDRNDLIVANGVRFAWFSFNPTTRRFSVDIEAAALPYLVETADRGIIQLEDAAVSIPDGRLGGKRLDIHPQDCEDGVVIVRYKAKWGTGILKGTSLKIKELGSLEEKLNLPNPEWREAVAKNAFHLKNMERTAVREIRQNLTLRPEINCSFSGGKDSTAVWNIAQKAGVTKAFFIDTGLEFPETIAFVKQQNVEYIENAGNFWQAVERAGPPAKDHRWCCKLLKLNPVKIHLNESGPCLTVQGNRWYESWNRAELEAVTQNPNNPLQLNISPIRSWRALDVFFYLWQKELPYNPLYEMGYERIGCYLCPAMLESELETMHHTHAEIVARWDEFLNRWAGERGLPPEYIGWGLWRWKEMPPKMKELVHDHGLDLTEHMVKCSTPASVASLMPEHQVGDIVDDSVPKLVRETPVIPEIDIEKVRTDFPMLGDYIYLDNGSTSFSPTQVIVATTEYDTTFRANVGRGVHRLTRIATQKYWHAHQKVAEFINGSSGTLVFTKNSTEALNMVSRGFAFKPGDVVVTTILEHHSNILPWRELQKHGIIVKVLDIKNDLSLDLEQLSDFLKIEPVKMVTVCHVSNVTGTVNPVAEVASMCHTHGAKLCVDAAQSAPKMPLDVEKLGCDYLAFSGHKMLAPSGTGALWMRDADLAPLIIGGGMVESVSDTDYVPVNGYQRYEAGSPNISGGIGFGAAVDYLSSIGMNAIEARERMLTSRLIAALEHINGVKLYCAKNPAMRLGAVSFTIDGISVHEAAAQLDDEYGIAVRSGMHCAEPLMRRLGAPEGTIRATPVFYTTETEIDLLAAAVREIVEKL